MSVDIDFSDHGNVLLMVGEAQDAEQDQREAVREAKLFLSKRDGMWDPYAWDKLEGRFRGSFDMCTPIVDQISGEIEQNDFTLKVAPASGDASKETADTINGLIRNIRNISNADTVFNQAGRSNVIGGFDAWEIVQDWVDADSFDQDLFIKRIPNAVDSVWFDLASVMQDRSDANWAVKLMAIPTANYKKKWPKGSKQSVGDDKQSEAFCNKSESITVGQLYYKKRTTIELVMMTNGEVYKDDEDFKKIQDELANPIDGSQPVTIELDSKGQEKRRKRKGWRVHSRMFDGGDWLAGEEETVFDFIPVVPIYGNFDIIENKTIYFGKIENLYDSQRSLNYAMSRDIEDGALSPSPSIWMTDAQALGNEDDYNSMNTDKKPVRIYNNDQEAQTVPFQMGGPQPSSGLQATVANMQQMIATSSNTFAAGQGNALAGQSGIAGEQQINQGNIGSIKWFKSLEIAICQTGKIIVNALPRVYDSTRTARILQEDGTTSMVVLNEPATDQQTGQVVELNDLTIGEYDVVCDVGPAFNSKQKEVTDNMLKLFALDPTLAQSSMDIMIKNIGGPGMDQVSERVRIGLINNDVIPDSQLTEEELAEIQQAEAEAAQQPPVEDPNVTFANAEMLKAQSEQAIAQNKQAETQGNQKIAMGKLQLENRRIDLQEQELQLDAQKFQLASQDKNNVELAGIQQGQQKLDQDNQRMIITAQQNQEKIDLSKRDQQFNQLMTTVTNQQQELKTQAETLKVLREAMGVDAIIGPENAQTYANQVQVVQEAQPDVNSGDEFMEEVLEAPEIDKEQPEA